MNRLALTLFASLTATATIAAAQEPVVAFENVTVIPLDRDDAVAGQTVVVRGEKIAWVGPAARAQIPSGATRIDGRGKFLMPGLAEMHAHVVGPQNPNHEAVNRDIMFLYVANGITSIRAMLGAPNQLPLREALKRGEVLGPTMYVSAPSLNGNAAPNPDSGATLVRMHKAAGYDFLKIHPQNFKLETYDAIVRTANEVGITWAGHVPPAVGLRHALASRQSGIDHLDGFLEAATPDSVFAKLRTGEPLLPNINSVDPSRFPAIANEIKRAGSWQVPTMLVWENLNTQAETGEQMAARDEMKYVSRQQLQAYVTGKNNNLNNLRNNAISPEMSARYLALRRQALKALADANAPLMMGTDSPQLFMVPGFAMHREIGIIQQAGVSPQKIYESGAKNVAAYVSSVLKQDGNFGTVVAGNRADLVLLDANPLQDVANLKRRAGVMVKGRWVSAAEIDKGLADLAAKFAQ